MEGYMSWNIKGNPYPSIECLVLPTYTKSPHNEDKQSGIQVNLYKSVWISKYCPFHYCPNSIFLLYVFHWSTCELTSPVQNGGHFADDISRCIFLKENVCILIKVSPKFVPNGVIDNDIALVYMIAWLRISDNPLSESMLNRCTDAYTRYYGEMSY